jgi:hypothetical protein
MMVITPNIYPSNNRKTIGRVNDFDSPRVSAQAQAPIPRLFTLEKFDTAEF